MRNVVLGFLYIVVILSLLYAIAGAYLLFDLWDSTVEIGVVKRDVMQIAVAIVLGMGLPYCMICYLRRGGVER